MQLCGIMNFFFQAEDGIRDGHVTGVQTCALPIFRLQPQGGGGGDTGVDPGSRAHARRLGRGQRSRPARPKIGRASCRERVKISSGTKREKKRRVETRCRKEKEEKEAAKTKEE